MTKENIVNAIAGELGLAQLQTKQIVQKTLDAVINALVEDGRVELRNFGVFAIKRRKPRKARNPHTGETVMVPERWTVTFKAGQVVEDRLQTEGPNHESG